MTRPIEPIRWKQAPDDAPAGAAEALRVYAAQRCAADERQRLSERLEPLLAKSESARARTPDSQLRGTSPSVRIVWLIAGLALAALVALGSRSSAPKLAHPSAPGTRTIRPAQPTLPALTATPKANPQIRPEAPPPSSRTAATPPPKSGEAPTTNNPREAPTTPRTRSARPPTPLAAGPSPAPQRELDLLRRAQQALNHTPSAAKAYLDEHARDYPHGAFVQEREMLSIELAVIQGDRPRARELARAFVARYPGSTYQARVQELLTPHRTTFERESAPAAHTQRMDPNTGGHHATGNSH